MKKNNERLIANTKQNLASEINLFYNQHIIEIDVAIEELMREHVVINKNLKKYDWFSSLLLHNETEGLIDYISNNPIAKNDCLTPITVPSLPSDACVDI